MAEAAKMGVDINRPVESQYWFSAGGGKPTAAAPAAPTVKDDLNADLGPAQTGNSITGATEAPAPEAPAAAAPAPAPDFWRGTSPQGPLAVHPSAPFAMVQD
jgi:hypothetical protein